MKSRALVLGMCMIVIAGIALLAPSLEHVRFAPGHPIGFSVEIPRPIVLPPLNIVDGDTPIWKILLLWLAFVLNLVLFFVLLPPDLRKRILRQMIGFAIGVLLFALALRYRLLKLPESLLAPADEPQGAGGAGIPSAGIPQFQPPQVASWLTYVISLIVLWLILLAVYFAYRSWLRYRPRRGSDLLAVAEIARSSLADLAAGRQWGDVVVQAYVRMGDAVQVTRGLQRGSSSTPREFAARLAHSGLPASSVDELTQLFESVRYGGRVSDDGAARRAAACLESILRACGVPA